MKFKKDFTTNSSSASFIVGFAKIKDYNLAEPYLKDYNITNPDFALFHNGFFCEGLIWIDDKKIDPDAKYVYFSHDGPDPAYNDGEYEEIEFEEFDQKSQDLYNNLSEINGFSDIQKTYTSGFFG